MATKVAMSPCLICEDLVGDLIRRKGVANEKTVADDDAAGKVGDHAPRPGFN